MKTQLPKTSTGRFAASMPIFANTLGDALSQRAWRLDSRDLCARARRKTGFGNFGEPAVDPALTILVTSLEDEANLHPLGRLLMRTHLSGILENRLKLAHRLNGPARPLAAPPIFITG